MCHGGYPIETVNSPISPGEILRQRGLELYVIIDKATWLHRPESDT